MIDPRYSYYLHLSPFLHPLPAIWFPLLCRFFFQRASNPSYFHRRHPTASANAFNVRLNPHRRVVRPSSRWHIMESSERDRENRTGKGGGIIKGERFTTLVWNSYALRTYHCLHSEGIKEPPSVSLPATAVSPINNVSLPPSFTPTSTLLLAGATGKDEGTMVRTRDILYRRNRTSCSYSTSL